MSEERVRAIKALNQWREGGCISTEHTFDSLLKYFTKKIQDETLIKPSKPQLIQGYTAEQWQEIIDGGYLCEVWDRSDQSHRPIVKLREFAVNAGCKFRAESGLLFYNCRPAQIKGIMMPIFVEPVDRNAMCAFFNNQVKGSYLCECKFSELDILSHKKYATKYIEL